MKVLVTGGNGYVGGVLLHPPPEDWKITSFERPSHTSTYPLPTYPNVTRIEGDLTKGWNPGVVKGHDTIIHLAGLKGPGPCAANPLEAVETNIIGTHRLIQAALDHGVKRFVFASTYWVYGSTDTAPFQEDVVPHPDEMYGISKRVSEMELIDSGLDYTILRFTNLFGPGKDNDEVVSIFIKNALARENIVVDGDGFQQLDFLEVRDAVDAIKLISCDERGSRQIFNIGSGNRVNIGYLASRIKNIVRSNKGPAVKLMHRPSATTPIDRYVSMKKLKEVFPEIKATPLDDSLEKCVIVEQMVKRHMKGKAS